MWSLCTPSHIALHTEWQHMLQFFSAKPWLAGPLYIFANNALTQSIIAWFCLLLPCPTQLTPPLLPLPVWSHYWGHTEIWQVSSAGMAEHCSSQATDILRKPSKMGALCPLPSPSSTVFPHWLPCPTPQLLVRLWLALCLWNSPLQCMQYLSEVL